MLLTLHRKAGLWLQFGGHFEPEDASILAAATREAREESACPSSTSTPGSSSCSTDRLVAPAFGRCAEHLDVRYAGWCPTGPSSP